MGVWGAMPWDNDGAADWFDNLFHKTKLAKYVEDTLKLDPASDHEEIRAAASILLFLGRSYIGPSTISIVISRSLPTALRKSTAST